jgi:micrococcal nuclease
MEPYTYNAVVRRVIDGDSIVVDIDLGFKIHISGQTIRLAGIDTPESRSKDPKEKAQGVLSTRRLKTLLPVGGSVLIRTDITDLEKYGRLLAEVLKTDGVSVNKVMIDEGYAVPYTGESKETLKPLHEKNASLLRERGLLL